MASFVRQVCRNARKCDRERNRLSILLLPVQWDIAMSIELKYKDSLYNVGALRIRKDFCKFPLDQPSVMEAGQLTASIS